MKINTIELPDDALNQHAAILGKTGSGKTYAAKTIVEHLLRLGRRVCVLDPTGAWYGMKSSVDGTKPGFPIVVFGGDHADVPINEHAGHAVGELVATQDVPSVIDLSGTTLGERHRFVERFAESLFRSNKRPLHLIIDEADEFAPQSGAPGTERMLGAIDRIVRRGRIKGFRVIMISQRPAVLNKNVLTQANTLIAMRLPATQDRKAIELWIKGQADEGQAGEVLKSLASLQRGEGWMWSPEHGVLARVKFPAITTFDSSRTPEDGHAIEGPRTLASVDLAAVNAAMSEAVEVAKENDPKLLRATIKELREELANGKSSPQVHDHAAIDRAVMDERRRVRAGASDLTSRLRFMAMNITNRAEEISNDADELIQDLVSLQNSIGAVETILGAEPAEMLDAGRSTERTSGRSRNAAPAQKPSVQRVVGGLLEVPVAGARLLTRREDETQGAGENLRIQNSSGPRLDMPGLRNGHLPSQKPSPAKTALLTRPQQKLIDAIAWWNALDIEPNRTQVSHVAGYTPSGGTWRNLMSECRSLGLIEDRGEVMGLTPAGLDAANAPGEPPSYAELVCRVCDQLTNPQRKVLLYLVVRGESTRTETAERNGYEASGGTFRNLLSELSGLGLITYPKKTTAKAADWLVKP